MKRVFLFSIWMTISCLTLSAQSVTGTVTDAESGESLVGANVMIEGGSNGTTTDENGFFALDDLKQQNATIIVSYVGYETVSNSAELKSHDKLEFQLYKKEIETEQIFVTASKTGQTIGDIAGRVELISQRAIKATSSQSVDDLFKNVSGLHVNRDFGIFDHSSVVNIRGVTSSEQGRVLVLIDGMPINKSDGGTVNWNRVLPCDIERVEIFKGPGSSIYGSNAMGGVINFITKKNEATGLNINAAAKYGTYNTYEAQAGAAGTVEGINNLYYHLSLFNRKSDGYDNTRIEFRDGFSIKSRLEEFGLNAKLGFNISEDSKLEVNYNYYDDLRGTGYMVEKENYMTHKTNYGSLLFNTNINKMKLSINSYYQVENYLRISEKYKVKNGTVSYSRYNVDAERTDLGANINLIVPLPDHSILTGLELKLGKIDGADIYQTSPDVVTNKGNMFFLSAFVQDEYKILDPLKILVGARLDHVQFSGGEFGLTDATGATDFMVPFEGELSDYDWTSFTPKISMQYKVLNNLKLYAAYSQGFRAASLDDLTRSGLISGGFKLANPELQPERIENIEFGFNYDINKKLFVMPSLYYMTGTDYISYIGTGDAIWGGRKKVITKDNITEVKIVGGDIDLKYLISANFYCFANYAYTDTEILEYVGSEDLEGKELIYTPSHLANLGVSYMNQYLNASLNLHYQSEQFLADNNEPIDSYGYSQIIDEIFTVDLKLWKKLFNSITVTLDIQNVFDKQGLVAYDRIAPGRMVMVGMSYGL